MAGESGRLGYRPAPTRGGDKSRDPLSDEAIKRSHLARPPNRPRNVRRRSNAVAQTPVRLCFLAPVLPPLAPAKQARHGARLRYAAQRSSRHFSPSSGIWTLAYRGSYAVSYHIVKYMDRETCGWHVTCGGALVYTRSSARSCVAQAARGSRLHAGNLSLPCRAHDRITRADRACSVLSGLGYGAADHQGT